MLSFFGANLMMQNYPDRPPCVNKRYNLGERAATNQTFLTRTEERHRMTSVRQLAERLLRVFVRTRDTWERITQVVVCA